MSIEKTLSVQKRAEHGKGPAGRVRANSMIPGVYYTSKGENISVQMPILPFEKLLADVGRTTVFNLEIDDNGQKTVRPAMIWQVQMHPYKKIFTHVDFYGVDLDSEVAVNVPLEFVGVSKGVKLGGVLETYREVVRLSARPLLMPKKITIDLTEMAIGDQVSVETLPLPDGVRAVYDRNYVIVSVLSKSKEKDAAEGEEGAAAE